MIRNIDTCGAYAIRPYPDERKDLSLRSILGLCKMEWSFFWSEKGLCEMVWHFFWPKKMVMQNRLSLYLDRKRIMRKGKTIFLIWKMFMQNVLTFYLNRKRVMRNGRKRFLEHVFERCFWGTYFEGVFFFVTKRKHSGFVVKIRSAKRKKSIWGCLFFLVIMYGRA